MAGAPVGNKNSARGQLWSDAIKRAVARKALGDLSHGLDNLAEKIITAALDGDQWALIEIGNRLDGKPAQALTVSGDADHPLVHKVERVLIRANAKD